MNLDNLLKDLDPFLEFKSAGRIGYRKLKPVGMLTMTKFSVDTHQWFMDSLNKKGYSIGRFQYALESFLQEQDGQRAPDIIEELTSIPETDFFLTEDEIKKILFRINNDLFKKFESQNAIWNRLIVNDYNRRGL